jgi:B12-binding domain/radical SAM domain protein
VELRALAISAPDYVSGTKGTRALSSSDPASLQNACRFAATSARSRHSHWGAGDWNVAQPELRKRVVLLSSLDDLDDFEQLLARERPNLLLIGAMTLCMPGAIACATLARAVLGDRVLIVLGGRHPTETIYLSNRRVRAPQSVRHHVGSPLRLMQTGRIADVFDLVISGDGEYLIAALGEAMRYQRLGHPIDVAQMAAAIDADIPGDWIMGWLERGVSRARVSAGAPADHSRMPSIANLFGVTAGFDVFGGRKTAHVFSDTGRGCAYDCSFCSERSSATGGLRDLAGAPARLHANLREAADSIRASDPLHGASAFIEDSVMLGGSPRAIGGFVDLVERDPIDIVFGAQFTIDQMIIRRREIARLADVGLRYVFLGVETLVPEHVGGMSKDVGKRRESWVRRLEQAFDVMGKFGIVCGAAVLFGLGEPHADRVALLQTLSTLRRERGVLGPISANWAVQHPLMGDDDGADYDYVEWGTPVGPFLEYFHQFGEASVRYPLRSAGPPRLSEVREIVGLLADYARPAAAAEALS